MNGSSSVSKDGYESHKTASIRTALNLTIQLREIVFERDLGDFVEVRLLPLLLSEEKMWLIKRWENRLAPLFTVDLSRLVHQIEAQLRRSLAIAVQFDRDTPLKDRHKNN